MHQISKKQLDSLLLFLDTLSTVDISPKCVITWNHYSYYYPNWSFNIDTARVLYDVSVRNDLSNTGCYVLDIAEKMT